MNTKLITIFFGSGSLLRACNRYGNEEYLYAKKVGTWVKMGIIKIRENCLLPAIVAVFEANKDVRVGAR